MFSFVYRASGNENKSPVILKRFSTSAFCDICPDAVSGSNKLFADSVARKIIPLENNFPLSISVSSEKNKQRTTNYKQLTTPQFLLYNPQSPDLPERLWQFARQFLWLSARKAPS